MYDIKSKVDKDGLRYHCDMIAVYLDSIRDGSDRRADISYHLRSIEVLFVDAELSARSESHADADMTEKHEQLVAA